MGPGTQSRPAVSLTPPGPWTHRVRLIAFLQEDELSRGVTCFLLPATQQQTDPDP